MAESTASIRTTFEADGTLLRIVLSCPPGNIIDIHMIGRMRTMIAAARRRPELRTVLFTGAGDEFSFGASIQEHLPDMVETLLSEFHGLIGDLAASGLVLLAAVRGRCLGGGLELAAFCQRLFAANDASFGNPEIRLGVFAPIASLVLPLRIGQALADDLLLTGRTIDAAAAREAGLIDELVDDPEAAACAWHRQMILPLSGSALRHAVRAARQRYYRTIREELPELERIYLSELMNCADPQEGIRAFIEKRTPVWNNR